VLPLAPASPSMPDYRLRHLGPEDRIERLGNFFAPHDRAVRAFSLDRLGDLEPGTERSLVLREAEVMSR